MKKISWMNSYKVPGRYFRSREDSGREVALDLRPTQPAALGAEAIVSTKALVQK